MYKELMNLELIITDFFIQYAYQPGLVYAGIVLFMTLSSFGLPIPEEIVLVSTGFIAYMAMNPDLYPAPVGSGADGVNMIIAAVICFVSVLGSDFIVFSIGRYFGPRLFETKFFKEKVGMSRLEKIQGFFKKYSVWACGIFRFTPGLRFPAHMTCGAMGISPWKFLGVDGFAALVSVPTQVILVAIYGREILENFKRFKLVLVSVIIILVIIYFLKKWFNRKTQRI